MTFPKYRSISIWELDKSDDSNDTLNLHMHSRLDFLFSNKEELVIPIDSNFKMFEGIKYIQILSDNSKEKSNF